MNAKIIVLDDDPTGSQTVHGCLLLTRWDVATLQKALDDASPLMFVLTNTRSMDAGEAERVIREVCENLKTALKGRSQPVLYVSRSDSTLRGHYPLETDVIESELGPFDAHFLVPAFFEAGRFTVDSVHYVQMGDRAVPAHETEYAQDSVFGYKHAFLPAYVEEKTDGRVEADDVVRISLDDVRRGCLNKLLALHGNPAVVVDAEKQDDLDRFIADVEQAMLQGKRFLFRSAASLITSLAKLPPQPVAAEEMGQFVKDQRPGVVVVGSYVKKTTEQLERLLKEPEVVGIEVNVNRLPEEVGSMLGEVLDAAKKAYAEGKTAVIYTSRKERQFEDRQRRLRFGEHVSGFLMSVVHGLPEQIGFIISKGGITSNELLHRGLALTSARLVGQILPGCSVVLTPASHRLANIPVVFFPGNVGNADTLVEVYRRLRGKAR